MVSSDRGINFSYNELTSLPSHLIWLKRHVLEKNQRIKKTIRDKFIAHKTFSILNSPIKAHSILKEISLPYCLSIYNSVMNSYIQSKSVSYRSRIYLDTFAGAGFGKHIIDGTEKIHWILGSPIQAVIATSKNPLDYYIFVEKDEKRAEALEERLNLLTKLTMGSNHPFSFLLDKFEVINSDINRCEDQILKIYDQFRKPHSFINNDPWGLQMQWKTFHRILRSTDSDILHNDMIGMICREFGNVKTYLARGKNTSDLSRHIGHDHDIIKKMGIVNSKDNYSSYYLGRISQIPSKQGKPRSLRVPISINMSRGLNVQTIYNLHYYCIATEGGSGYLNGIKDLKRHVELLSGGDVNWLMDQTYKGQLPLHYFEYNE